MYDTERIAAYDGFWGYLCSFLKVSVNQTLSEDVSNIELPLVIQFTVSNGAPIGLNMPEIIFEEVQFKFGIPPEWYVKKIASLARGQSITFEHHCSFSDVTKMQYQVEGKLSPRSFSLQIENSPLKMSLSLPAQTMPSYFKLLNLVGIHKWLENVIKTMPIPGPNTTLAEIETQQKTLGGAISEISETETLLSVRTTATNEVAGEPRERFLRYRQLLHAYLQQTEQECGRLEQALRAPDARNIEGVRRNIVERLSKKATEVDLATADLKKFFNA